MYQADFFKIAENQFNDALPFVLYRKPNSSAVKGFFQENDVVYNSEELTESGFIFSPFNAEEDAILIPLEESEVLEINYSENPSTENQLKNDENFLSPEAEKLHIQLVSKAIQSIKNNAFKKVVVSRKETIHLKETNAVVLFQRLLNTYKNAFVYCWYHPKVGLWLGATPETLLSVTGNRFTTMSLAGTQAKNKAVETNWQSKETEEQQLVTNFIVESLESKVETLTVGKTETVEAGNLLHLRTKISGLLNTNLKHIVSALHPTPAVCGLPKNVSKQFILENENYKREFYTGFLGELNLKEEKSRNTNRRNVENNAYGSIKTVSNLYVNLRCMKLTDTKASLYVGGGITKDSIPENEFQETVNKAETMKKVLF
jgi:isochorismate synthase